MPISFFKNEQIICQGKAVEKVFLSSGTTGNQSKHLISDISIYKASYTKAFELFYGDVKQYCILSLLPNYREQEDSSLIYMVDDLISKSENIDSGYYLNDYKKLDEKLKQLEAKGQKTILFGVSMFLDLAEQFSQKSQPYNNYWNRRTKGKKEIVKEELHQKLKTAFSLATIHSEYGMSELLSQSYSNGNGIFNAPHGSKS